MKKIELIWREVLTKTLENQKTGFSQKELAERFQLSTSVVFQALKKPRDLGAVKVGGRGFELADFEKLLFLWATERNLKKDIAYQAFSALPIMEIEGLMPASVVATAYTAYRFLFKETPADYNNVYFYSNDPAAVEERFPQKNGEPNIFSSPEPNLFILKPDVYLKTYQPCPPLAQIFVDLWNLSDWYAKEYQLALLEKIKTKLNL